MTENAGLLTGEVPNPFPKDWDSVCLDPPFLEVKNPHTMVKTVAGGTGKWPDRWRLTVQKNFVDQVRDYFGEEVALLLVRTKIPWQGIQEEHNADIVGGHADLLLPPAAKRMENHLWATCALGSTLERHGWSSRAPRVGARLGVDPI